ncbi:Endonuclease/exonuclease/phosphatase [Clohesyomyces aquaticus]|uniref:Endonuclease/exonuclease/phosphatase n=1 Tax=Clohesyomyces aquaticus TaxID=1231657 RepID=A0A1Y1ZN70_9PLEO|nr:Endonuclease/exonuclease/phosphatase [Clohesyomyces aquaticus]
MATNASEPSILDILSAKLASGPAQKREDEFYSPRPQSYWHYDDATQTWQEHSPSASSAHSPLLPPSSRTNLAPQALRLISWNIDILVPFIPERMSAALLHLSELISSTPSDTAVIVMFQEMGKSDMASIRGTSWVQERFFITDTDERNWLFEHCGTTMLVDRRLGVRNVIRVPWISKFERDGLFVDVQLEGEGDGVLRLCNTHLESLVADPPIRSLQLAAAAPYLDAQNVAAALLAGDLNAIQPFDRTLHTENGLKDAYLELGGKEDSEEGYTWGYQVPAYLKDKFGCSRMDKIFFRGEVEVKGFQTIGVGVKVAEEVREEVRRAGELEWVSDHYGVMGDFEIKGRGFWGAKGEEFGEGGKVAAKLA